MPPSDTKASRQERIYLATLALAVGAVAICGIIYQLVIGTVSTYLEGNSTYQFSITIGLFMSAYGIGSFLSTRVEKRILDVFVLSELIIGVVGGTSTLALFSAYASSDLFWLARGGLILVLGTLVGLEIPLLIRLTEAYRQNLRVTVGQILGFDYIGALVGGLAFPLLLLPWFGFVGAALYIGVFNTVIAGILVWVFRRELKWRRAIWATTILTLVGLGGAAYASRPLEIGLEQSLYEDRIVHMEQTPYQRIVMTRHNDDTRLFLDGALQFSSIDEYRYHESLIHPAATRLPALEHVLILGGGDGLALRELSHYPELKSVTLVDLDPAIVELAKEDPVLRELNGNAFTNLPVEVVAEDAFSFVRETSREGAIRYDLIVVDLPDPRHESLAKLYSVVFYRALHKLLTEDGLAALQIASPFFANRTFWCAVDSLREAGLVVHPYHANVPSFGEWGFALAGRNEPPSRPLRHHRGRYYDSEHDDHLFYLPPDLESRYPVRPNTLLRPRIVRYFETDWRSWN